MTLEMKVVVLVMVILEQNAKILVMPRAERIFPV